MSLLAFAFVEMFSVVHDRSFARPSTRKENSERQFCAELCGRALQTVPVNVLRNILRVADEIKEQSAFKVVAGLQGKNCKWGGGGGRAEIVQCIYAGEGKKYEPITISKGSKG